MMHNDVRGDVRTAGRASHRRGANAVTVAEHGTMPTAPFPAQRADAPTSSAPPWAPAPRPAPETPTIPLPAQRRGAARHAQRLPLRQRTAYALILAIGLAFAAGFAVFWFNPARLPRSFSSGGFDAGDAALFAALTFVVWHRQAMDILSWLICGRMDDIHKPPLPGPGLRVAFITTFVPASESIDILARTLRSMLAADYPHDTWVLDEGDDPAVRDLCWRLGVGHFSRNGISEFHQDRGRFLTKSKAGNHNAWYAYYADAYDVVAQIDSDFQVRRDFLTKTLGYFRDPKIAFVGTPQIYGNMGNWITRGAAQQTYLFYGPLMRAFSRRRMALLIGANHVIRVAALRDVGWYQGHLTEDLATGMRFHAARWQSVYVPQPLAVGEGPTNWTAYFNQQYRWAFGCLNILFAHVPRLVGKMRRDHGALYFLLAQFYLSGLSMAVGIGLLMLYFVFGWAPARIQLDQLVLWYGPLILWRQLIPLWLQRFNVRPKEERGFYWAARFLTIATIPVYFLAFVGVLRNKRVTFKTTPKGDKSGGQDDDALSVFRPHLLLGGTLIAGLTFAVVRGHTNAVFLAWGVVTVCLLSAFFLRLLFQRLWSGVRRRRNSLPAPVPPLPHPATLSAIE